MQLMAQISEQNGKQIVGMCQKVKNMLGPEKLHMVSDGCHFSACWPVLIQSINDNVSRCWMKHSDTLAG